MTDKTIIKFFGCKAAPFHGAARDGCAPDSPEAASRTSPSTSTAFFGTPIRRASKTQKPKCANGWGSE